jgi:hypothetical protein
MAHKSVIETATNLILSQVNLHYRRRAGTPNVAEVDIYKKIKLAGK